MNQLSCILLVDDDAITNFTNQMLLEDMEVSQSILVAPNGRDALEVVKQNCDQGRCPDLILLDINMPVMNGFEFLDAYEKLEFAHKQSVVIVMLTTSLNPGDVDRLQQVPIKGILNKPLTEQMVREVIEEHFNRQQPA